MRVAFAADDDNETTRAVRAWLDGHAELVPVAHAGRWPEVGEAVAVAVAEGGADLGVVMCWTGTGVAMAANKVPGIRAALAWDPWVASGARRWNDANVLAMSLRRLAPDVAVEVTEAFLSAVGPDPDEADAIAALAALERRHRPSP